MGIELNSRFLSLVIHDLRTPLNVIGLTLRLIEQSVPKGNADVEEDLLVVRENVSQIERMLTYLTEYCRLIDDASGIRAAEFDPRRMLAELVEEQSVRSPSGTVPIQLDLRPDCPEVVELDPTWARVAVQHALANAVAAAEGSPIRVTLGGPVDRLSISTHVDRPPPVSVQSVALQSGGYERLFGTPHERRGLDLAITARVSELFGGSAYLDIKEGQGSTILLDWPTRLASS